MKKEFPEHVRRKLTSVHTAAILPFFLSFCRRAGWVDKYGPPTRTKYRVIVENLSSRVSWQVSPTWLGCLEQVWFQGVKVWEEKSVFVAKGFMVKCDNIQY